jgi:hypothetical protein
MRKLSISLLMLLSLGGCSYYDKEELKESINDYRLEQLQELDSALHKRIQEIESKR